jgi:hypothetical protein
MSRDSLRPRCLEALAAAAVALIAIAAPHPAQASDIRLRYEDTMEDVRATVASEKATKAAFLLRFPDFISWSRPVGDTLRIAVAGDDALLETLAGLAEQENLARRAPRPFIAVAGVAGPVETPRCEILALGDGARPSAPAALQRLHRAGTLTVGTWNEPRDGTIIHLFRDGDRVRFAISRTLAAEAGLQISSKLLNLAASNPTEGNLPEWRPPGKGLVLLDRCQWVPPSGASGGR